jgi:putative transposase
MSQHLHLILSESDRSHLESLIKKGSAPARTQTRARILLLCDTNNDPAMNRQQVAQATLTHPITVGRICRTFANEGRDAALYDKPRPGQKPKITGEVEAHLVVLACSDPPKGRDRWTLQLLADKLVELHLVDAISGVAVYQRLKKMKLSLGK